MRVTVLMPINNENLRAGWTKAWGKSGKLVTSLNTTVQYRRYQAEDIFNIKRNDRETYVHLSAGHKKLSWKRLYSAPELGVGHMSTAIIFITVKPASLFY